MNLLKRLLYKKRKFYDDDFDWNNYTADSYHRRLKQDVESQYQARSGAGDLSFDPASGRLDTKGAVLHPNQVLILETIGRLQPASVHEVGCGGGDHISTAQALFPEIMCFGGDRGASQLDLAVSRHPHMRDRFGLQDITMPYSRDWPKTDLVYSQAVLMHIHTAVSHFVALSNMFSVANNQVLLVENVQCHDFVADLHGLWSGGHLPWPDMHLYLAEGSTGARGVLASRVELSMTRLESDAQLREGQKPSARRLKRAAEDSARAIFGFARI
ncbi:MAG: hypothetical protein EP307_03420 [Rhodobacteraceae bacterium]|nr:MAG: hypothetical protein EP307_03420 [Paracoccaceae bacterium]